jgi:hypothetical protein
MYTLHHQRMPSCPRSQRHSAAVYRVWKNTGFSGFGSCTYEARHCGQQYMTSNHRVAGSSPVNSAMLLEGKAGFKRLEATTYFSLALSLR